MQGLTPIAVRIYYAEYPKVWATLQFFYAQQQDESAKKLAARRLFFRKSLTNVLAGIEAVPQRRTEAFSTLLSYITEAGNADGLETVFLTLLAAVNAAEETELFQQGVEVWRKYAAAPSVPGAGPWGFYNVVSRELSFFPRSAAAALRSGKLFDPSSLIRNLKAEATLVIPDIFEIGPVPKLELRELEEVCLPLPPQHLLKSPICV